MYFPLLSLKDGCVPRTCDVSHPFPHDPNMSHTSPPHQPPPPPPHVTHPTCPPTPPTYMNNRKKFFLIRSTRHCYKFLLKLELIVYVLLLRMCLFEKLTYELGLQAHITKCSETILCAVFNTEHKQGRSYNA